MFGKILKILIIIAVLIVGLSFVFWDDIKGKIDYSKTDLVKINENLPHDVADIQFNIKDYEVLDNGGSWGINEPTAKVKENVKNKDFWLCGANSDFIYCSDREIYKKKDIEISNILGQIEPKDICKIEFCEKAQKWNYYLSETKEDGESNFDYYMQKNLTVSPEFTEMQIQEFYKAISEETVGNLSDDNLSYVKNADGSVINFNLLVELKAYNGLYYNVGKTIYIAFDENGHCYIKCLNGNSFYLSDEMSAVVKEAVGNLNIQQS